MTSPQTRYGWNQRAARYVDDRGRFVSRSQVREAVDGVVEAARERLGSLTRAMSEGRMSLAEWQMAAGEQIKALHLATSTAAKGGWEQMGFADFGRAGQVIRGEYELLERFARQIASGEQAFDGRVMSRVMQYAEAGRSTYEETLRQAEMDRGLQEERAILGGKDHCDDCLDRAGEGWQPIGTLLAIGDGQCGNLCNCTLEYR